MIRRFVAQRPEQHAGVVFIPFDHADGPVHDQSVVERIVAGNAQLLLPDMRFNVGLVHDDQPQLIRNVVGQRMIRIMRGAEGVDVVGLHQLQIGDDFLRAQGPALDWIGFMAVDAFEHQGLPVEKHLLDTVDGLNFDFSQPDPLANAFHNLARCVFQREDKRVKMRLSGCPQLRLIDREVSAQRSSRLIFSRFQYG